MSTKERKSPRAIVHFVATLKDKNQSPLVASVVDISSSGARIYLNSESVLAEEFILEIAILADLKPLTLRVQRVWQASNFCGVRFLEKTPLQSRVIESLVKIHRAELSPLSST